MQYVGETTTTKSIRCRGTTPIELEPATVHARRRCAHGTHIVFVASNGLASTIMRGSLTVSVLNQSRDIHGVRATMCGPPCDAALLARHLQLHGPASACIVIKYATRQVHDYCRSQNMIVALDNVDNYRAFDVRELHGEHYQTVDALLVQTRQHAEWVGRRGGLRGVVMPHPHGNLNGWSLRHNGVRPHIREVGLVVGDAWRNMPTKEETVLLAAACCASNASLRLVFSLPNRRISTTRVSCPDAEGRATCLSPSCPNATDMGRLERLLQLDGRMQGSSPRRIGRYESDLGGLVPGGSGHGGSGESWCARLGARLATLDTPTLYLSLYPSLAMLPTPARRPRNCLRRRSLRGDRRGTGPESPWTMSRVSRSIMSQRSCATKWTSRCCGGPATSSAAHSRWPIAPPRGLLGGGRTAYQRSATQWSHMSRRRAVSGIQSNCST